MRECSSRTPSEPEPEPYTGCPGCTSYAEYEDSLRRLRPLSPDAVLAVDPDGINWNEYYWGYHRLYARSERRTIVRPLPRSITDRIPLELFEDILSFLRWETKDLYNCALVCRAWHHHSQRLLYSRVLIESRAAYDAVARASLQNRKSRQYLRLACASMFVIDLGYEPRNHFSPASVVLGRSLPCLQINNLNRLPHHSSLALQFSCCSALVHLTLQRFHLNSFTDLRHIICGLKNLRELTLDGGRVSTAGATSRVAGFPPVRAPRLSKVSLHYLHAELFSGVAQWIASTEICHGCTNLSLITQAPPDEESCTRILQKLGPSLTSLDYRLYYIQPPVMLAYCTLLSAVGPLDVIVNPMDSWRGLVTALHGILSHFSSPVIRTLQLDISMRAPNDSPSTSTHPDSEFWTLDLGSIHDLIKRPLFNSLRSANICMRGFSSDPRLTCDAVLTAEEMERRVRLILEPWDKRGILTAEGYNEPTDEAIRWEPAMDGRDSEKGGSGGGVGGEEAQSSEDKAAFASDQEDEDEDSLEGSTQDLVEDRE